MRRFAAVILGCVVVVLVAGAGVAAGAEIPPQPVQVDGVSALMYDDAAKGVAIGDEANAPAVVVDAHQAVLAETGIYDDSPSFVAPNGTGLIDDGLTACRSFSGDTEVLMADGTTKPISEVEVGDEVFAADPGTGESGASVVVATIPHTDQLLTLRTSVGEVVTTEDHLYWNYTDGEWQESQLLDAGDRLLAADGAVVVVEGLDWSTVHIDAAYDLDVAGFDTFYVGAGDKAVLVHNIDCSVWERNFAEDGDEIFRVGSTDGRWPIAEGHPGPDSARWRYHDFVVRDDLVFDEWTSGIPLGEFMQKFPGWSVDDLVKLSG